jgi:hypothetical protein
VLAATAELRDRAHSPDNLLFTPYARLMTGSWDLRRVRRDSRVFDLEIPSLGLEDAHPAVVRAVTRFQKSTGERPGTERALEWLEGAAGRLVGDR